MYSFLDSNRIFWSYYSLRIKCNSSKWCWYLQRSFNPGIKKDKTMADKFIYIPNDDTQNYPFCTLKLVFETFDLIKQANQNSIKVLKVLSQRRKKLLQNFEDSCTGQPIITPLSLLITCPTVYLSLSSRWKLCGTWYSTNWTLWFFVHGKYED